jgi:hypothetical protein
MFYLNIILIYLLSVGNIFKIIFFLIGDYFMRVREFVESRKIEMLICLMFCVIVVVVLCACKNFNINSKNIKEDTSLIDVKNKGVLTIGCDNSFPPM